MLKRIARAYRRSRGHERREYYDILKKVLQKAEKKHEQKELLHGEEAAGEGIERDIPEEYNMYTVTSIRPRGASDPRYADYLWIGTYKRNDWRGNRNE